MNVLITGGSRGIGLAVAKELALNGHRLLLAGRDVSALEKALSILPSGTLAFSVDLEKPEGVEVLADNARRAGFSPDVLVLNAAAFSDGSRSVVEPDASELERVLRVNLTANYRLVQKFLPFVRKGYYPRIIIIGSTAALRRDTSLYGISKAALANYALGLREELKPLGVGVTLLHPGGTFTERRVPTEQIPGGRLLESADIGKLVQTLLTLSPQAVVEELVIRPILGDTF